MYSFEGFQRPPNNNKLQVLKLILTSATVVITQASCTHMTYRKRFSPFHSFRCSYNNNANTIKFPAAGTGGRH